MAGTPTPISTAEKKKLEAEKRKKTERKAESMVEKAVKPQLAQDDRDWSEDLVGALKSGKKGAGKALDVTTDLLIDKEAWKRAMPGGEKLRGRDVANMALDASILVPGVGLAGGVARAGARGALKYGAREAAEAAAPKLTGLAAQVAERNAAKGGARVAGREAVTGAGKHRGAAGVGSKAGIVGGRANTGAKQAPLGRLLNETIQSGRKGLEGAATRQTRALAGDKSARILAGKGTRVGFNQTKKRIAGNALLAGAANLGASGYNAIRNSGGDKPAGEMGPDGVVHMTGAGVGAATGYYFVDAAGESTPMPDAIAKTLAASYQNMGGSPDGSQVIYLGR
jgi:hypothetical protein